MRGAAGNGGEDPASASEEVSRIRRRFQCKVMSAELRSITGAQSRGGCGPHLQVLGGKLVPDLGCYKCWPDEEGERGIPGRRTSMLCLGKRFLVPPGYD